MDLSRKRTSIADLLDFIKTQLSACGFSVEEYPNENLRELYYYLAHLNLPAGVVIYAGSVNKDEPSCTVYFKILLAARDLAGEGKGTRTYLEIRDKVYEALDYQLYKGQALFKIQGDKPADIDPGSATVCCSIDIMVEDN